PSGKLPCAIPIPSTPAFTLTNRGVEVERAKRRYWGKLGGRKLSDRSDCQGDLPCGATTRLGTKNGQADCDTPTRTTTRFSVYTSHPPRHFARKGRKKRTSNLPREEEIRGGEHCACEAIALLRKRMRSSS